MLIEDVLEKGLRVVFCGTALGRTSNKRKAYYAHGGNKFWPTLHEIGLTDRLLKPDEYKHVLGYRIGLTDLCKSEFGNDDELSHNALDSLALRGKIEQYRPSILAFTSQTAGKAFCGRYATFGWQESSIEGTRIYILPSTSVRARRTWALKKEHWSILAETVRALPTCEVNAGA
jgi:double-stranded uracil-DNA glycosylase